jgi:hypothetical protein
MPSRQVVTSVTMSNTGVALPTLASLSLTGAIRSVVIQAEGGNIAFSPVSSPRLKAKRRTASI